MKKFKKMFVALAVIMVFTLSSTNVSFAKEVVENSNFYLCENNNAIKEDIASFDAAALATQGTYNFNRTQKTYTVTGRYSKSNSSYIELNMPRGNNNRNLVQGTVYLIPMAGGTSINKAYANYSGDSFTINLSDVPNGIYMVKISGSAVGASGTATVSLTLY